VCRMVVSGRARAAAAPAPQARRRIPTPSVETTAPPRQAGPTIIAVLEGGSMAGRRLEAEVVEGRPPGTIDVQADDGSTCRYCLAEWAPADPSAVYAFLYPV
jgi:hypothetical protein